MIFANHFETAPFSYLREFVILEFQHIAHIHAKGEQGNGNLGYDAGVVVFDKGVITPDINDGAKHGVFSLFKKFAPGDTGGEY